MTGADVEAARARLGMSAAELGRHLELEGRDPGRTVRRWETGHTPVPGPVRLCLAYMLKDKSPVQPPAAPHASPVEPIPRLPLTQEPEAPAEPSKPWISSGKQRRRG